MESAVGEEVEAEEGSLSTRTHKTAVFVRVHGGFNHCEHGFTFASMAARRRAWMRDGGSPRCLARRRAPPALPSSWPAEDEKGIWPRKPFSPA